MTQYSYDFPRPALGTDVLLFSKTEFLVEILLIERKNEPFADYWAFPGGFVEEGESCEEAVIRELKEETGIIIHDIAQLQTFSKPYRDPRGWVVTVAFWSMVDKSKFSLIAGDDAKNAKWFSLNEMPKLAFDHSEIFENALELIQF